MVSPPHLLSLMSLEVIIGKNNGRNMIILFPLKCECFSTSIVFFCFVFASWKRRGKRRNKWRRSYKQRKKKRQFFFLFSFLVFHSLHEFLLLPHLFFPFIHFEAFVRFELHANGHYIF